MSRPTPSPPGGTDGLTGQRRLRLRPGLRPLVLPLLWLGAACQPATRFEPRAWALHQDGAYPHRAAMVDDLLARYPLVGLSASAAKALLGPPDTQQAGQLTYQVSQESSQHLSPPQHRELELVLLLSPDSVITRSRLMDWHLP